MLTHKTRDFTIAHFKFNSTKSKRTQTNANGTIKQMHLLSRTESHSGKRRCVTPIWNLAEFNYVAMFRGELTESLGCWIVSQPALHPIRSHELSKKQLIVFSAIAKVE